MSARGSRQPVGHAGDVTFQSLLQTGELGPVSVEANAEQADAHVCHK